MQGAKKDWEASGIHKTTKTPPAFGTRVPERMFCVLRFGRAKIAILNYQMVASMNECAWKLASTCGDYSSALWREGKFLEWLSILEIVAVRWTEQIVCCCASSNMG